MVEFPGVEDGHNNTEQPFQLGYGYPKELTSRVDTLIFPSWDAVTHVAH